MTTKQLDKPCLRDAVAASVDDYEARITAMEAKLTLLQDALNDSTATLLAVRATARSGEWLDAADHFAALCHDTIARAIMPLTTQVDMVDDSRQAGVQSDFKFLEAIVRDALEVDVGGFALRDHPHSITSLANEIVVRVFAEAKATGRDVIHLTGD